MNETEKALFSNLSQVRRWPVDPSEPGEAPTKMLPVSSILPSDETTKASSQPEGLGPVEQAMRRHPNLTREKAEEMLEAYGF